MSDFHFVDSTILIDLGTEAVDVNPTALDALYAPNRTIVITTTIYDEVTTNPSLYPNQAAIKSWLDAGIDSGQIIRESTPGFPAGVANTGELSLVDVANNDYYGEPVTFVSNDGFFNNFEAITTVPNQQHYSHQQLLVESLFEGGLSAGEYFVAAENMQYYSGEVMPFTPGQTIIGTNGVVIEPVSPFEVVVTSANGTVTTLNAFERFSIDNTGNVEKLGMFIPGTGDFIPLNDYCFLGDTAISMWPLDPSIQPRTDGTYDEDLVLSKVWKKPISEIKVGDLVVSYDDKGQIAPGPVSRTMQNNATHILDFWDTGVTPGHAYLCGDGKFKGQHVPLMDILRTDGAIVRDDGTLLRAATNYEVGSLGDRMINATASVKKPDGTWSEQKRGQVRFGTRIILPDGRHMSFMEMAESKSWGVSEDGFMTAKVKTDNGVEEQKFFFPYAHGEDLPKPEDYILSRSEVSLQDIYAAGEWEQIGTRMPAPANMVGLNTHHTSTMLQPSKPEPNIPPAFANRPDVPRRTLNRKQRKAMEAKQRKASKVRKRVLVN